MNPNPGGILKGNEIVDRDFEITRMWRHLKSQSVLLLSERRVGKTCLLRKMEENPQDGWKPILYFVEGKSHPIEFVEGLYNEMLKRNMVEDKFHRVKSFYKKYIGGEQIGSWTLPQIKENWKTLLENIIEDIANVYESEKILFMFDELPLMLWKISKNSSSQTVVMDMIDLLRELRQKFESSKRVRFIFSGSIGLNLVINKLKKEFGYIGEPTNDMVPEKLCGMEDDGALLLCQRLTEGAPFKFAEQKKNHIYLSTNVDNLPFYIQLIFERLYDLGNEIIDDNTVDNVIDKLLNDPTDRTHFNHFVDRIETYYNETEKHLSMIVLNYMCKQEDFIVENEVKDHLSAKTKFTDEDFLDLMNLLWEDHYLERRIQEGKRQYKFKYSFLRKWWKVNRG